MNKQKAVESMLTIRRWLRHIQEAYLSPSAEKIVDAAMQAVGHARAPA